VSHETIYLSLFVQSRGALRKELARYLRSGRARRRPRGLPVMNGQGQLRGTVPISARPAEAADRAVPGTGKATCCSAQDLAPSPPSPGARAAS
jgi:IS30 family transposase